MFHSTPYFPALRSFCAPLGSVKRASSAATSLPGLANLFGKFFAGLLEPAKSGAGSRVRDFSRTDIFWAFLSQVLTRGSSCKDALLRLHAHKMAQGRAPKGSESAYCQARARLSLPWLQALFAALSSWFEPRVDGQWLGRTVRLIDGTGFSMPDSPKNSARWPYAGGQKPGCGFPVGKLVGLFCLHSGRLIAFAHDIWKVHDLTLARLLLKWLKAGEVLVADRAYCSWVFLALLRRRKVDFVIRLHNFRKVGLRRVGTRQELWPKPQRQNAQYSKSFWKTLPNALPVRLVRFAVHTRGFRVQHVTVVTSLLDVTAFPDLAIARLYAQRWQVELNYRQIKTILAMDNLRGLSPQVIEREIWLHAIAYNLVHALMLEAAITHAVPVLQISFKGSLDALRAWADLALRQKKSFAKARRALLQQIAGDLVPLRPNRHEPRAKKRRPKNYQFLTKPRKLMRVSTSRALK